MKTEIVCLIVGALLVVMALSSTHVKRLPFTPAIVYLSMGGILGPWGSGLFVIKPILRAPSWNTSRRFPS